MNTPSDVRLMVAVPTMGGLQPELAARLINWAMRFPAGQINFYFSVFVSPVDRARNQIVENFLAARVNGQELTHLLMIDSDTTPPLDAVERLLSHDLPFVSGLTPIASRSKETGLIEYHDNCFLNTEADGEGGVLTNVAQRHTGLQQIIRCGASCLMVKREVFEAIPRPHFLFEVNEAGTEHSRSEDIRFCDLAKDAGYTLFADTDVVCTHTKSLTF